MTTSGSAGNDVIDGEQVLILQSHGKGMNTTFPRMLKWVGMFDDSIKNRDGSDQFYIEHPI